MSLPDVYRNFVFRTQNVLPTDTVVDKGFRFISPRDFDPDEAEGVARTFTVYWEGSDPDLEPTDMSERVADHTFTIEIAYSTSFPVDVLNRIFLSDRNDLIKALRIPSGYKGTGNDNPTVSTGLWARRRARDEIDRGGTHTWYLRQTWVCTCREDEV
jgi:hypothetical protein